MVSKLVTQEQLEVALRAVNTDSTGPLVMWDDIDDDRLADKLVDLEYLNRWQVEQLRAGRTKFTLGPYRILDSIGQGGMGHVFKCEHSMLGRIEAVKVLPKSRTTDESIERFQREIRAQAQLDHPNLVRVSYAGYDGPTYFFVTEYVAGTDLRRLVRSRGRLSMEEAATIISQAARALQYAHELGLVHRDIKPGNLLVTPEGYTKVTDLGLAWFLNTEKGDLDSRLGKIVGTADYLAPETIKSPTEVRPTSDIYSLGCTLYYAVTGKVPFPGGTMADKLRWHCNELPINPRRFNPILTDDFMDVLSDMMEKDPERRIASAEEVQHRLTPWTLDAVPEPPLGEEMLPNLTDWTPPSDPLSSWNPSDTDSHFLDELEEGSDQDSPSQASQHTEPIASSQQETLSMVGGFRSKPWYSALPLSLRILVAVAVALAATVLATLFW